MKRILKLIPVIGILFCITSRAQTTYNPMVQSKQVVWGQGFGVNGFSRFPSDAQLTIPSDVWTQTLCSSGLQVKFVTNATSITVNYKLVSLYNGNNWFSSVGSSGVDMYARKPDGKWYWCFPNSKTVGTVFSYTNINPNDAGYTSNGYEYCLYFPTFAVTTSISVTVNAGAKFDFIPVPTDKKPIVIYGTSVVHGAVCSRSGNTWTNIVSRNFADRSIINLGFSGVGRVEPEVIKVINKIDAEIYVIDCLPNYSSTSMTPLVDSRYKSAVDTLRKYHPAAAILLTEHQGYSDMDMWKDRKDLVMNDNIELKKVYDYFILKGYKNLYYLSREDLGLDMATDIGDYVHPNDKGMYRYADVYSAKISEILSQQVSSVKQLNENQIKIYPNPGTGDLIVENSNGSLRDQKLEVYNEKGQLYLSQKCTNNNNKVQLKNLNSGYNILKISDTQKTVVKGFLVK